MNTYYAVQLLDALYGLDYNEDYSILTGIKYYREELRKVMKELTNIEILNQFTLQDCIDIYATGYTFIINDGKLISIEI